MSVDWQQAAFLGASLVLPSSAAWDDAQSVQLGGVYGDARGCMLAQGQEVFSAETMILSRGRFLFHDDECSDVSITPGGDGTFELSARCQIYDDTQLTLVPFGDRDGFSLHAVPGGAAEALEPCR